MPTKYNDVINWNGINISRLFQVSSLIAELAAAAAAEKGLVFEEAMEDRLCAYSRAVAHFPTAVKEVWLVYRIWCIYNTFDLFTTLYFLVFLVVVPMEKWLVLCAIRESTCSREARSMSITHCMAQGNKSCIEYSCSWYRAAMPWVLWGCKFEVWSSGRIRMKTECVSIVAWNTVLEIQNT